MRQVPKYLIVGSGRLALHFCNYLKLLNLLFTQWSRKNNTQSQLEKFSKECTHVLLLINDEAVENFILNNSFLLNKCCMHCSGSLVLDNIYSAHPLMTFGKELYNLTTYLQIPFILEENSPNFEELLPRLPNKSYKIPNHLKSFYHTLCVLSGNFTCLLWQKFFSELETTFKLPREIGYPYLKQVTKNIEQQQDILTGPLVRGDWQTISANLDALYDDPYREVYQAFVNVFQNKVKI
ncbi:MAG: hypothetical protein AMJ43_04900 [Coxiella sp. DG_40]|nr:MAG: hypothetical protein AMJ43_04900 [Coxiella sp. DG_40]